MKIMDKSVYVAAGAQITGDVTIGAESSVWYNAVVRGMPAPIAIGRRSNVQDNVVIHGDPGHEVVIGDGVSMGHGAIVHGCRVGNNTLIGMGAIILDDAVIGDNCIIGAGALVTQRKVIPDGSLVIGSPARVVRQLTEAEIEHTRANADNYVRFSKEEMARLADAAK